MQIIKAWPPNITLIRSFLPVSSDALFCYGSIIYNPSGRDILPDQELHEEIHSKEQEKIGIDNWWYLYLNDPNFRLEEELQAYGEQYAFAKKHIKEAAQKAGQEGKHLQAGKSNLLTYALESMARALSGESYGKLISYGEAESKLRNYARQSH